MWCCVRGQAVPHILNTQQSLRMSELFTQWHYVTAQMAQIFSNSIVRSSNLRSCKIQLQMKNTIAGMETYLGLSYWQTCSNKCRPRNKQIHVVTQQKPTVTWWNPTKTNKYMMHPNKTCRYIIHHNKTNGYMMHTNKHQQFLRSDGDMQRSTTVILLCLLTLGRCHCPAAWGTQ